MRAVTLKKARSVDKTEHLVRRCRQCGCTDMRACAGGCWWVEADLCSSCKASPAPDKPLSTRGAVTPTDRRS